MSYFRIVLHNLLPIMKNSCYVLLLCVGFLLSACSPHYIAYHVTSDKPHSSHETNSEVVFIGAFSKLFVTSVNNNGPKIEFNATNYSVLAAHESGTGSGRYFIMFAPGTSYDPSKVDDVDFNYSSSLLPTESLAVLNLLDKAIKGWDIEEPKDKGTFYNFTTHTELNVKENVLSNVNSLAWVPSITLCYNRTHKGSSLTLFLGSENWQFIFTMTDLSDVKNLRDDILHAETELKKMGMP